MEYMDEEDHYTVTIPYLTLENGVYKVTVKAEAVVSGNVVAKDEKDGGSFTVDTETTSITDIEADITKGVTFYTLHGIKVAKPSQGLYIRVEGNKVDKIIVR